MEIKASDLKQHNWIHTACGYEQVIDIMCDCVNTMSGTHLYSDIMPIKLDPEILLKVGFEQNEYLVFTKDYMTVALYSDGYAFFDGHHKIGVGFRHVHTFQNVFFALTSTELKLEL